MARTYGPYRTLLIDPPWRYPTSLPGWARRSGDVWKRPGSLPPYPTLPSAEIIALPVGPIAARDAHLYLWTTTTHMEVALRCVRAWGFTFSTPLIWLKPKRGRPGFPTWASRIELCFFCRRGTLPALHRWDDNVFAFPRGRHSVKPPAFRGMFAQTSPGPRIELFARDRDPAWDAAGLALDGVDIRVAIAALAAKEDA